MKSKNYFLRLLLLAALLLPGVTWSQVAKVSEYDFNADTATYTSIVGNGGTAWSAADVQNGYTTIAMPFGMQYGQTSIGRGATLYVSQDGYVTTGDATMTGIVIAPLGTTSGFTGQGSNTIYSKVESNKVTIEWRKLKVGNNTVSFQLVLSNTGAIRFNYGPMTLSTTSQVFAGMQSSANDVYCMSTVNNRWDTIVPSYLSLTTTRTLSPAVHPYYDATTNQGLSYTFTQPECAKPNSFTAVPGDFNVTFNWTGNGSKYQIKYNQGADFTPMTEGILLDNLTGTSTTVTNLPQRTTYYAYIRAFCQTSGSWSAWRAVSDESFTTGCGNEPLPMVQDFTSTPICWDFLSSNPDASNTIWIDGDGMTMRAGTEDYGYANTVYAVLPKFDANLNNYELDITASVESPSYGTLTLGYLTNINNMSGFVALTTIEGLSTSNQDIALYLTDYAAIPSNARLALRWSLNTSYYDCYIDQITVKPQPTCFPISNLQVTDINPTSAKFTFTDGHNTSATYQLVYGAPGFDPATATPVTITNGGVVNTLEGSTHYEAYVRAICGTEQLDWVGPVDFFTPCPSVTVSAANPFKEEFNSDELPNCWSKEGFASSDWSFESGNAKGSSSSCGTDCEAWLYTPVFSFGTGDIILSFKHKQQDWSGDQNYLTVYYRTSPSDEWHQIVQYTNSISDMTNEEMILPNTANASQYQLAFTSTNNYGYAVYLDDIKVRPAPNCAPATNLAISPSKVLTWTAGNATQWQVRYAIAGSDNYTFVGANAATVTLPLTGEAGTQFEISVRSICGVGDTNDWSDPVFFTMPISLPYSCDFEDGATGFITQSTADNAWVVGTAKSNGGNGYYVSNDGTSNAYSHGSNIAYAYVTLPFENAGDYMVKYDWTANGESTWDFLRVALVPDNVTLITTYSNSYNNTNPTDWIPVDGGSKLNLNTSWNTHAEVVNVTTPGIYKLVFAWMNDGSGGSQPPAAIDNVSVRALNCNAPTNIALSGDGAVTWTAGNTTQWQVRWAEEGSSNYTYAYVSTPSYTSSTWIPNTNYTIDIRSICGANDTLDWMTYDFTMPCLPMTITADEPYFEGFESTTFPSECWQNYHVSGPGTYLWTRNTSSSYIHTGSGSAKINDMQNQTLTNLVCPPIAIEANQANGYGVEFWMYRNATGTSKANEGVRVWASHTPSTTDATLLVHAHRYIGFEPIVGSTGWYKYEANIPITGTVYIIFEGVCEYGSSSYMDDITIFKVPTCPKPNNIAASDVTSEGATISWNENNGATTWRVLYGPAGFDRATEGNIITATGTASATITGLNPNTSYDVYVRSVCEAGVDSSAWSDAFNFRTACGSLQALPFSENFSGYTGIPSSPTGTPVTTPYCWSYYSNGTNTPTSSSSYYGSVISYGYTSSYACLEVNNPYLCMPIQLTGANVTNESYIGYETSRGSVKIAAMPLFDQPINNVMVSFDYKMSTAYSATGAAAVLELGYITDNDFATFQSMQSWNAVTTTQHIADMSLSTLAANAPANARLAFRFSGTHNGTGTYSYSTVYCGIDNIVVKVIPNCFAPQASTMAATDVTPTSATVSWVDQNTNTPIAWKVKYSSDANFDPTTDGTATTVSSQSINLTNLSDATLYYVYVGVDCGSFGESEWSDAFTFTTLCNPKTLTLATPFVEDFDSYTAEVTSSSAPTSYPNHTMPNCWNFLNMSQTTSTYPQMFLTAYSTYAVSGNCLFFKSSSATPAFAVLPKFTNALGDLQMSFTYRNEGATTSNGILSIGYMTNSNDPSTFVEVESMPQITTKTRVDHMFNGDNIPAGDYFIAFKYTGGTSNNYYLAIDDIEVSVLPPCVKPNNVHTTALAYNAATIDWTQNSTNATEGSWEVMFGESPLDVTTATVTTLSDHVFNATGLDEQVTYDFYVRANCGADGYSDWSDVFTFTTPCAPITVTKYNPYIYGFEDVAGTGSSQPINGCWAKGTNSSTAYPYPAATPAYLNANTNPITPTNSYYLYMYGSTTYYSYAVLPEFSNPLSSLQLSLKAMRTSSNSTYGVLQIGYMTDPTDINTFVMVQEVQPTYAASPNYNWQTFTTYFDNVNAPAGARMAFMVPAASTNYTYVDDIEVMPVPTCRVATNLTSENVYAKTANLSWTDNCLVTPAAWEVRYAPVAADLDNEGESIYPTSTSTALANLLPETDYQWKVRSICVAAANNDGDTADWSTVANFSTTATCVVPTIGTPVATENSVTLSWDENTMPVPATTWEVAVGEMGFNQNIAGQHFTTTQNTNYVVNGLRHSTAYQVYVRSLCSDEDWSDWSVAQTFNTSCGPWQYADMPLVQTFPGTTLPNCWTKAGGSTGISSNRINIYGAHSMVILPEMGFALDTIEMSFEAANYSGTTERSFQIGYLADGLDTTSFTAVETITLNSASYNQYNVSFADINNTTGRYIAIRGIQTGTTWADFNVRNVQVKLREPIAYLPSNETESNCVVFYMADTVNHEGTYAGNVNMTQIIYPGEPGKVLHLTGIMDCEYGYDFLTIYEGVGTNGTILFQGTGYNDNIDIMTDSYDWVNKGAMTIVFTSDVDNSDQYLGFKLLAQCECPSIAPQREWTVDTNTAFTWVNGRTYTNNVTVANQPDKSWSEEYMEKNVGGCDSVYHTLQLNIHPTYNLTATYELCQPNSYEFYGENLTATGVYTRTVQTIYGADSTTTLTLQAHPAPTAYIYVNGQRTNGAIDAFCDNADLVMTARSTIEGSTYKWDDNSTAAVRTVNPHENANYTVTAYDPVYGCASNPVDLAVTTTPVPVLSIEVSQDAICAGASSTLTVTDANNTGCTYQWSNGETGNSITVTPTATTEYTVTATTPNTSACTATASATITVNPLPVVTITPSATQICRYDNLTLSATEVDGYTYEWNSLGATTAEVTFVPTATASYTLKVIDENNCSSEFTSATVTVRPAYNINDTLSICEAMLPYTWGTQTLNDVEGGDYVQTWTIGYGCDSTVNLHLDVTATGVSNAYATYCEGANFTFGQGEYLTNHVADLNVTSLSYVDTTSNVCPVQYNLFLTVNPNKATSFFVDECDSYTWNNVEYTVAGEHVQNLQTVNECDSIVTMNLTLRHSTTGIDVQNPCDKLVWIDGHTYTEDNNTAQYTIQNVAGCDSLVTLNLTLRHANTGIDNIRWCNTPEYTWIDGVTYDMNETDGNVRYLLPGVTNQAGCDSVQILNLVFNLAADTLAWADTSVCDILILDTVACDGSLVECQIDQDGQYELKTSIGNGRYVVSRYNVTITHSDYHTSIVRNVCLPYEWRDGNNNLIAVINDIYNTTGDTNISITFSEATNGCDRTEVLRLIGAKPQTYNYVDAQICLGESYNYGSVVLTPTAAGTETHRIATGETNAFGCDSTDFITLTTYPTSEETLDVTFCENDFEKGADNAYHYTFVNEENSTETVDLTFANALNGQPYNGSTVANWTTENGCARTVTVNFTVNPNTSTIFETTQLYTYTWNGVTYDNEGFYTDNAVIAQNVYGCDSLVTLKLTLHDTVYNTEDIHVCTSYEGPDNVTYRESKTFTKILKGASQYGTDSVLVTNYIVNLNPLTDVYVASTDPYTWIDNNEYTTTGEAFFTLSDVNNCDSTIHLFFTKLDSIVLCEETLPFETEFGFTIDANSVSNTYMNNDPMGNDTIVSYVINMQTHNVLVDNGCDSYTWDATGLTYTESGVYVYDYTNAKGCASADTLKLTVYNNTNSSENVIVCDTYDWTNHGTTVTKTVSGVYTNSYLTVNDCPSVDTLYLTVNYNTNSATDAVACDSYLWNGTNYDATGEYTYDYTATNGCASVDTLHLTIGTAGNTIVNEDVCNTYTWAENGQTYTESIRDSVVMTSFAGCDSTIILNLVVRHNTSETVEQTACDSFTWAQNGFTYTTSGNYTDTITNEAMCDSIVTLALTVNNNSNTGFTETACNSYEWTNNGNVNNYTVSGTYYSSYNNLAGCPSVDTLYLTVNHSNSYDTTIYSSEGFYEFTIVANDVTYDTLFQANTPTTFGPLTATFTNADGCDSVVNYTFVVGTTRTKTDIVVACQEYTWARNGETYVFINAEESAAHNNAIYKTINGTYIYEAPIVTIVNNNAIDSTFILQLALSERVTSTADVTLLLSDVTITLGDSVFNFSAQKAAGYRGYTETVQRDVHFASNLYCDSVVTYNINLVYNYDTTWMDICAEQASVEWGSNTIATTVTDTTYVADSIGTDGWFRTLVINQKPVYASTDNQVACDSFTWVDGNTYTANNNTATWVYEHNGCDSTVTLNLTLKYNSNTSYTEEACDTYTWVNNGNTQTYTESGTYYSQYNNADQCPSVDTLYLTINKNAGYDTSVIACDTYTWHGTDYTASTVAYYQYNDLNGCASEDTLNLTIKVSTTGTDEITACDSLVWIDGITYTINNYTAQHTIENVAGCDSLVTLNLTINHATHNTTVKANECDSYVWETSGMNYQYDANATYPLIITHNYVNGQNCPSVDTLKLTLHQSSAETFQVSACDSYEWDNNGNVNTYTTSGVYTSNYTNLAGCASTDMLYLTINSATTGNDEIIAHNGYYTYDNILYTADRDGNDYFDTTFSVASGLNAAGCDSITMLHLLVGTDAIGMENQVVCDHFTWINGKTYQYRENAPAGALYWNATDGEWVYARPRYTLPGVVSANGFDTIAVLNLTLTQINYTEQNVRFLLSQKMCYLTSDSAAQYSINFSGHAAGTVDTAFSFGATSHYCDSIITYHITLVDNYTELTSVDDICATAEEYTWDNTNIMGGHSQTYDLTSGQYEITDFDHVSTITLYDTVFKGDVNNEWVYAKVITIHPLVYATERRTVCDSLRWNGTLFTESTTTATRFFPNGSSFGCDSTVTLNLTVNYNSSTGYTVDNACDEYTWALNNETYTTSGDYYRSYTATNGCPSVDTLHLTVNYKGNTNYDVTACDIYTWNSTEYTTSGQYAYAYYTNEGCASIDSLNLTIMHNSNSGETVAACDSYEWTNNGNVNTYTASGIYYSEYTSVENCPSVDTLYLTINHNDGQEITESVCDTYTWAVNGQTYTETGIYTYDSTDANGCYAQCKLDLTVGYTTNNAETVVACHAYNWHGTDYSTSGDKFYAYTNNDGCPSVDTLHLTINNQTTYAVQNVENCGPYTWIVNDSVIGVLEQSVETSTSIINPRTMCDSVIFLRLTVYEAPHAYETATVCADAMPYNWRGYTFNEAVDTAITTAFTANCDSTIHFTLTVNPLISVELTDAVCLGQAYNANDFVIAATELAAGVHTFSHTVPSMLTGCDSTTTLTLTVGDVIYNDAVEVTACDTYSWNAGDGETYVYTVSGTYNSGAYPNTMGCTSIDVLDLTINNNTNTGYTATACDSYTWNGVTYNATGDYTYSYNAENNCPSVDTLHLTINNNSSTAYTATACDSYEWNGTIYTVSGDYTFDYSTLEGCNSVDTLHLTVNHNSSTAYTATACDSYEWNGTVYTTSGDYTYSYNTTAGCASVDTLHLTVNYNSNSAYTETACESYTWNGTVYTTSGDYTYSYNNAAGCASVDTLHLTVNYNSSTGYKISACDSYEWNGQTYTSTGVYYYPYNTAEGCASLDTLVLTVKYNSNAVYSEIACDSYEWNGTVYTTSGNYTYHYNNAAGCASVDTLHLKINYNSNSSTTAEACDSYTWNNTDYTVSGTYFRNYSTATGCESVDTLYLTIKNNTNKQRTIIACNEYTWNGETYYQSGDYLFSYEANNGCPSVDTLHLTVNYSTSVKDVVEACDEYTWNGTVYNTTGIYIRDYVATNNCESSDTLMLTINESYQSNFSDAACNFYVWDGRGYTTTGAYDYTYTAANGCDSVVTLNLTINNQVTSNIEATACNSYTWNGAVYTASGIYTQNFVSATGCDSVVTLTLTINQPRTSTLTVASCDSYTWHGTTYTTSGNYTYTTTASNGCDSIATLVLTINNATTSSVNVAACDSYTWHGTTYTTSGNYNYNTTAANGCDSIVTLHLTLNNSTTGTVSVTTCGSYTWMDGNTYTASTNTPTVTLVNANGCDSVVTLHLTINQTITGDAYVTACGSYTWEGTTYTTSGTYTHNYTAANNCDSVVTLNLTINQPVTSSLIVTACDSYTWEGVTYNVPGNYTHTYTAANGCDSIVTLVLSLNYSVSTVEEVTECDGFIWIDNINYTESTNTPTVTLRTVNGCDSVVTLHLTINHSVEIYDSIDILETQLPFNYHGNTIYAEGDTTIYGTTVNGCDSTVYLHVSVQPVGIEVTSSLENITVYPNPTRGHSTVTADDVTTIEVYDIVGHMVAKFENTNQIDISNLAEGSYTLRITTPNGTAVRRLIKK